MITMPLPADVFWLLRVPVKPGSCTPYHCWLLWAWQFGSARAVLT
jgi:hypothetical protein